MLYQDKIYGQIKITEPVILELLGSPQMERLKKVHQSGNYYYTFPEYNTTRFEHSVGAIFLLKKFSANLEEQVAGLLHDISHGAFSHVLDHLYKTTESQNYQDSIHQQYFNNNLKEILAKFNLDFLKISNIDKYPLLDQPLPNICADRLDYTLRDSALIGHINKMFIDKVLNNLIIKDNKFVFQDFNLALQFANVSYWMCRNIWHPEWGEALFQLMAEVLKIALEKKFINQRDLDTNDELIMGKLENSMDEEIATLLFKMKNLKKDKVINNPKDYDYFLVSKNRVIDPLVKVDNQFLRVSELNSDFKSKYENEKERVKAMYLKILD